MNERSKTNKEIYEQLYLTKDLSENPMKCAEAIGYLRALTQYFPSEEKWAETEKTTLLLRLVFFSI